MNQHPPASIRLRAVDVIIREQEILRMRFGLGDGDTQTLRGVGGHLGLTRERVRQIQRSALNKLRGIMEQDGLDSEALGQ